MLAISTSPASAGASSSAWVTTGSMDPVVAEGSGLPYSVDVGGSPAPVACCADSDMIYSMVGGGLQLLSVAPPTMFQLSSSLRSTGSDDGISCNSTVSTQCFKNKYSTTLLKELTSWEVVSVTFSFLATRFRATFRGLLGSARRLASKLVGGSSMRGILGSPGRLNLDHS
jgi:hypothetical protein